MIKMKYPDEIRIGFRVFDLILKEELNDENGDKLFGRYYDEGQIIIRSQSDEDMQKATLLHEMLHAISTYIGADLTEGQTRGMANNLFMTMKYNHELFEELLRDNNRKRRRNTD